MDLAVRDPSAPGRYLIGIECDGAKYHSSVVARERDRLREQILVARGWRIHRVWSTDWYRSRAQAEQRLLAAVVDAQGVVSQGEVFGGDRDTAVNPMEHATQVEFEEIETAPYVACASLGRPARGELHKQSLDVLCSLVEAVVQVESPIHTDDVIRRIRTLWGLKKTGSRIQEALERGIATAVKRRSIRRNRSSFLRTPIQVMVPVRRREGELAANRSPLVHKCCSSDEQPDTWTIVTGGGARCRDAVESASEVQDEISRWELARLRASTRPARRHLVLALRRRDGRMDTSAVRSTRRAEEVLGSCDRDGVDTEARIRVAASPSGGLPAVGTVVDACRSQSPRPHDPLSA